MQFDPYVYSFSAYNVAYPSVFFHKKRYDSHHSIVSL